MNKIIFISAGHSNADPGAQAHGLREADFTLLIRNRVAHFLKQRNYPFATDGADGLNLSLPEAQKIEKTVDGIKVEFHLNSGPLDSASGVEALSLPEHRKAAQKLAITASKALNLTLRGESGWKNQNSGAHSRLGFCLLGGIILEVGFITSQKDMDALNSRMEILAENLADQLINLNS